jgi:hypothetical protein
VHWGMPRSARETLQATTGFGEKADCPKADKAGAVGTN